MIENSLKPLAILGIVQLFTAGLSAQSMYFNYTDDTNLAYNLEDVQKITFDSDLMKLHLIDGSTYSWNVSTISYNEFDENSLNIDKLIYEANFLQVLVFPNPTNSALHVQYCLPKADFIRIELYDLQGILVFENKLGKQTEGQHQTILDLSNVPDGIYLCHIIGEVNSISKRIVKQ